MASKCSAEDWAELYEVLTSGGGGEAAEEDLPTYKPDRLPNNATAIDEALKYAPGIARISVGDGSF